MAHIVRKGQAITKQVISKISKDKPRARRGELSFKLKRFATFFKTILAMKEGSFKNNFCQQTDAKNGCELEGSDCPKWQPFLNYFTSL
jgi:hypothetical protein